MPGDTFMAARPRQDRDDEKTIPVEHIDNPWSEKKDSEEIERPESTAVVQEDQEAQVDPADDFPDGGLKAWLCVIGVRVH